MHQPYHSLNLLLQISAMRPLKGSFGTLSRSDGSATFASGRTLVTAGVFGPVEARSSARSLVDRAHVEVSVQARSNKSDAGVDARSKERLLRSIIEATMIVLQHPRAAVHVGVHCLDDDGGLLATSANAVAMALIDAALPLSNIFAAVNIAIVDGEVIIADPTTLQLESSKSAVTLVFDDKLDLLASHVDGPCIKSGTWQNCLRQGREEARVVLAFIKSKATAMYGKGVGDRGIMEVEQVDES